MPFVDYYWSYNPQRNRRKVEEAKKEMNDLFDTWNKIQYKIFIF